MLPVRIQVPSRSPIWARAHAPIATGLPRIDPPRLAPTPAPSVRRPLVWLLIVLAVGLGLRLLKISAPLELDEFPPLYAVAERHSESPDLTPAAAEPLKPVSSLAEVRERSVLPYGIVQPVPLYHYLLYFIARVFPVTEWALAIALTPGGFGLHRGCLLPLPACGSVTRWRWSRRCWRRWTRSRRP